MENDILIEAIESEYLGISQPELKAELDGTTLAEQEAEIAAREAEQQVLDEKAIKNALLSISQEIDKADIDVRHVRNHFYKKLGLYWEGDQILLPDGIDGWKPIHAAQDLLRDDEEIDLSAYAKVANVYQANGASIIASLSAAAPKVKYIPDDADNDADIDTALAYQLIQKRIEKFNNPKKLITKALKIKYNQGLVFGYIYPKEDAKLGYDKEPVYAEKNVETFSTTCPACGATIAEGQLESPEQLTETFAPCPNCGAEVPQTPMVSQGVTQVITDYNKLPKIRVCIDLYGPLNVEIPLFVNKLSQVPVLTLKTEMHYSHAAAEYNLPYVPEPKAEEPEDQRETRLPYDYMTRDDQVVTVRQRWFRPWAFNIFPEVEVAEQLKAKYPKGCYAVFIDEQLIDVYEEDLDDRWVTSDDPLDDFLQGTPHGKTMVDIQDMVNELLNLTLDTVEHNIPELFVRPETVGLDEYKSVRSKPGNVTQARPRPGLNLSGDFFQPTVATLSQEHNQFSNKILELGQVVSGAMPTIYGGALKGGSNTAREYESSRAMSLQRLAPIWEVIKNLYADCMKLAVPLYASAMRNDEKIVEEQGSGYLNIVIQKSKLQGKVGEITYDTGEQIPISWAEERDVLISLIPLAAPGSPIGNILAHPENASFVKSRLGLDVMIPGDIDRKKQLAEISELLKGQPIPNEEFIIFQQMSARNPALQEAAQAGMMQIPPQELPSVPIDPELDNHMIELEVVSNWLKSSTGRNIKAMNPLGYKNVYLHFMAHKTHIMLLQQKQMQQQANMQMEEKQQETEQ